MDHKKSKSIFIEVIVLLFGCFLILSIINTQDGQDYLTLSINCDNEPFTIKNQQLCSGSTFFSSSMAQRPALPDSFISPQKNFNLHYTTQGKDSVAEIDINGNLVPDRIEQIAEAFEKSYSIECEQLGYRIPRTMKNGTVPYDIYVLDLTNQYAVTVKEGTDSTSVVQENVSSYILFDNDFIGHGFHIQGENVIKVTAAHEFFHAIQLGYVFRNTDSFFFELSAVWMEDQVFDDVDNYLYYLDYFFSAPDIPLNGVSFTIPNVFKHIYGSCIFGFYIAENFGTETIYQIWQLMPDKSALEAMDQIFKRRGSSFENEFVKFCVWNFFTGKRAVSDFSYNDATTYPEVNLDYDQIIEYYHEGIGSGYFLTASYNVFHPLPGSVYKVNFSTEFPEHWRLGVLTWNNNTVKTHTLQPNQSITLEPVVEGEKVVIIPCNVNRFADPTTIYFKQDPEEYLFTLEKERKNQSAQIKSFEIHNVFPNPFSESVSFNIRKISTSNITLRIFNIQGQLLEKFNIGVLEDDLNRIEWLGASSNYMFSSGLYLFQFSDGSFTETKKVVLYR